VLRIFLVQYITLSVGWAAVAAFCLQKNQPSLTVFKVLLGEVIA